MDAYKVLGLPKNKEITDEWVEKNYKDIVEQLTKMKENKKIDQATYSKYVEERKKAYEALKTKEAREEYAKKQELEKLNTEERKENTVKVEGKISQMAQKINDKQQLKKNEEQVKEPEKQLKKKELDYPQIRGKNIQWKSSYHKNGGGER